MTEKVIEFTAGEAGERLDKVLLSQLETAQIDGLTRVMVQSWIRDGRVTVDGKMVKPGVKLRGGEVIRAAVPQDAPPDTPPQPEPIALTVVYEDDDLAVIDKPTGLVVHPGVGVADGTLVNALLARWPQIAAMDDPDHRHGIVHRLDKDTSGLIVIAKNTFALKRLMAQFQARTVEKIYIALLERAPKTRTGRIEAPIGRDPRQRKRMAVLREGKPAVTEFTLIDDAFKDGQALVEFNLMTGRTHQIRVHAAFIGTPVVGDAVYGYRKQRIKLKRNFLHAARLTFEHPRTSEVMTFESPLPALLAQTLEKLR